MILLRFKQLFAPFPKCRVWYRNDIFKFKFDFLTDVNNYRKTNLRIKRALKKNIGNTFLTPIQSHYLL